MLRTWYALCTTGVDFLSNRHKLSIVGFVECIDTRLAHRRKRGLCQAADPMLWCIDDADEKRRLWLSTVFTINISLQYLS